MTPDHPIDPRDDLPHDPALTRLLHAYATDEPPAAIDAAILAAAQQALVPRRRPWWQRLQTPVAVAATVMLAVMLTLTMERNPPDQMPQPSKDSPAANAAPAGAAEQKSAPRQAQQEQAFTPAAPAITEERSDTAERTRSSAKKVTPPPAAAPAESTNVEHRAETEEAAGLAIHQDKAMSPAAPSSVAAPMARPAPRLQSAAPVARQRLDARTLEPEAWIANIRTLRQQGQQAEAASQWQAFRKTYPDYPLPEDLRESP